MCLDTHKILSLNKFCVFIHHYFVQCNFTTCCEYYYIKVWERSKWHAALSSCLEKEGINVLVQSLWLFAGIGLWHKAFLNVSWCGWLLLIWHHSPLTSPFLTVMSASTNEMGNLYVGVHMHVRTSKQDVLWNSGRLLLWKKVDGRHHVRLSAVRGMQALKMKFCRCGQESEAPVLCAPVVWTGSIMTATRPTRHQTTRVLHCPVACAVSIIPSSVQLNFVFLCNSCFTVQWHSHMRCTNCIASSAPISCYTSLKTLPERSFRSPVSLHIHCCLDCCDENRENIDVTSHCFCPVIILRSAKEALSFAQFIGTVSTECEQGFWLKWLMVQWD